MRAWLLYGGDRFELAEDIVDDVEEVLNQVAHQSITTLEKVALAGGGDALLLFAPGISVGIVTEPDRASTIYA
jgi:hypothetical protein